WLTPPWRRDVSGLTTAAARCLPVAHRARLGPLRDPPCARQAELALHRRPERERAAAVMTPRCAPRDSRGLGALQYGDRGTASSALHAGRHADRRGRRFATRRLRVRPHAAGGRAGTPGPRQRPPARAASSPLTPPYPPA